MAGRTGGRDADDEDGLTPREWLEHDAVPLTPDVDLSDDEQRRAWIRANNDEMYARSVDAQRRRRGGRGPDGTDGPTQPDEGSDGSGGPARREPGSSTTVIAVRVQNAEHRALVRLAHREAVTVSDLVRRWMRVGLEAGCDVDPVASEPDERALLRESLTAATDATVGRIVDELRRWRELVAAAG